MKRRIIFVDDEINLLDGLRRMLRKKKDEWDMIFVESGKEALEKMEDINFNILVTDFKMPGMDGIELMQRVKEKYPDIRRIILTGQSKSEIFNKAKEAAHAYIPKPCNSNELISIIEKEK